MSAPVCAAPVLLLSLSLCLLLSSLCKILILAGRPTPLLLTRPAWGDFLITSCPHGSKWGNTLITSCPRRSKTRRVASPVRCLQPVWQHRTRWVHTHLSCTEVYTAVLVSPRCTQSHSLASSHRGLYSCVHSCTGLTPPCGYSAPPPTPPPTPPAGPLASATSIRWISPSDSCIVSCRRSTWQNAGSCACSSRSKNGFG